MCSRLPALLLPARQLSEALLEWWRRPEAAEERQLELARAAAARRWGRCGAEWENEQCYCRQLKG